MMATGGGDPESLADLVICDICFEVMSRPQALNCLHHFCYECTMKLTKFREQGSTGIECPFCKRFTPKEEIQDSFVMNKLLDIYHRKEDQKSKVDDKSKDVVDANEEKNDSSMINIVKFCKFHPGNEIKYSCIPCKSAICAECKIERHDTHPTESVEKALNTIISQARQHTSCIAESKKELKQHITKIKNGKTICKDMYEVRRKQIEDHKSTVMAKIEADYNELMEDITGEYTAKTKELDLALSDSENQVAGRESLLSWTYTITGMTGGPGPLCELQGGLLQRLQNVAKDKLLIPARIDDITLADFEASRINATENYVGVLMNNRRKQQQVPRLLSSAPIPASQSQDTSVKQKVTPQQYPEIQQLMQATNQTHNILSFRSTSVRLSDFKSRSWFTGAVRKFSLADTFILEKETGFRLCHHNNQLWLPTSNGNSINVYSVSGTLQRSMTSDRLQSPRSIHPIDDVNIVLADENALFLMDSQGTVSRKIIAGNMWDLHVDGNTVVALEGITWDQGKVHVLNRDKSMNVEKSFLLERNPVQSIMIVNRNIHVSFEAHNDKRYNDYIGKYDMNGNKLAQYGKRGSGGPGELQVPALCASDPEGTLLINDYGNKHLQMLDSNGQWSVIMHLPADNKVFDAVFEGDQHMYVLCSDSQYQRKIFKYKI